MTREILKDAESVRRGQPRVASQPLFFPPHPVPGGMLSRSIRMPSRKDGPPSIWDTHGTSGNVFATPVASSSAPYPQELNPWSSHMSEPIHSSTAGQNGNQTPDTGSEMPIRTVSQKFSHPLWGRFFEELWSRPTTTAYLTSSFWQIP